MKRVILSILTISLIAFTSCKDDDVNPHIKPDTRFDSENFKGEIKSGEDIKLDASKVYKLTGALIVKKGGKLSIPAGTKIVATKTSSANNKVRYIAVEQGAQIFINGNSSKPVIMTCEKQESESWGGLVICGYAPTNKSNSSAGAEVSGLSYGGDKKDDNSGVIEYLLLEYTGYKYTDTKEFNGLSLFGVGSGTKVDYVVSYKGGDDGMEFFGGTVNASHMVSVDSEDDGIDFADGWSGTGEFWVSINSKKSGIEGSNNGDNGEATPMTNAKLKNITVYGMGEKPVYFKEGSGKISIDNIVIGGLLDNKSQPYFYYSEKDMSSKARIESGDIKISNVRFVNMGEGNSSEASTGITLSKNESSVGAGNGINKPDWLPSSLNTSTNGSKIIE